MSCSLPLFQPAGSVVPGISLQGFTYDEDPGDSITYFLRGAGYSQNFGKYFEVSGTQLKLIRKVTVTIHFPAANVKGERRPQKCIAVL